MSVFDGPEIFCAVMESLPAGIYLTDRKQKTQFGNTGAVRITGHLRQEVVGHFCGKTSFPTAAARTRRWEERISPTLRRIPPRRISFIVEYQNRETLELFESDKGESGHGSAGEKHGEEKPQAPADAPHAPEGVAKH